MSSRIIAARRVIAVKLKGHLAHTLKFHSVNCKSLAGFLIIPVNMIHQYNSFTWLNISPFLKIMKFNIKTLLHISDSGFFGKAYE